MKKSNREKLIRATGMLQGLGWVVEEKCECSVDGIWFIIQDLEEIIEDEKEKDDDR